jgi:hypothetical protein
MASRLLSKIFPLFFMGVNLGRFHTKGRKNSACSEQGDENKWTKVGVSGRRMEKIM